jgi:hypothetical protein
MFTLFAIADASAQQRREREWVPLGCYEIRGNSQQEAGRIRVDIGDRRFSAIRLGATGSTIRMFELNLIYPAGDTENIPVDQMRIGSGSKTGPLELPVNPRDLREIQLIFRSSAVSPGKRTICVEGQITASRDARNWQELGCHIVDFDNDVDKFRVTNEIGPIEAVRLKVRENDVRVMSFTVGYFDGSSEELVVEPPTVSKDRQSQRITLQKGPQRIRNIELYYSTIPNIRGTALVCVEALVVSNSPLPPTDPDISSLPDPEVGWTRFGCQTINGTGGIVRISVGRDRGRFSAVRLQAFQNNVYVEKLEVIPTRADLGRKLREKFWVRRDAAGNQLRFEDRPHRINAIELRHRASQRPDSGAVLCIEGKVAESS